MKNIIKLFTLGLIISISAQIHAAEGYVDIDPVQPTQSGDKIEVLEIFWYGCPHCYDFEPYITDWLQSKPDDVAFRRMPGLFRKSWIPHARAFYTAEKLGVLDTIHNQLFTAIHKERKNIQDDDAVKSFFVKQGIDKSEFIKAYESDEVDTKVKQAYVTLGRYKKFDKNRDKHFPAIDGVPAIIVNGKYLVSGSTAGSFDNVLNVIDQLIEIERAAKDR